MRSISIEIIGISGKNQGFSEKKVVPGPETAFTSERILEELTNESAVVYGFVFDFLSLIDRDKHRMAYPAPLDLYRSTFVCVHPYVGILLRVGSQNDRVHQQSSTRHEYHAAVSTRFPWRG